MLNDLLISESKGSHFSTYKLLLPYGKREVDYTHDFSLAPFPVHLCALILKSPRLPLTHFTTSDLIATPVH